MCRKLKLYRNGVLVKLKSVPALIKNVDHSKEQSAKPYRIRNDDCLKRLRKIEDNRFHSMVVDPPSGTLVMNSKTKWDHDHGGREHWILWLQEIMKEAYRTLRPGAYSVVWALPRTSHWSMTALENAGFEIVDVVVHLYARSLIKGMDASKAIDNYLGLPRRVIGKNKNYRKANTDGAGFVYNANKNDTESILQVSRDWEGWRSNLKPAAESWILVRKPLDGNTAENILKYDVGAVHIGKKNVDRIQSNVVLTHSRHCTESQCHEACIVDAITKKNPRSLSYFTSVYAKSPSFVFDDKISGSERKADSNNHPTPKTLELMKFFVDLVTPKNGEVLDCFAGSGSTGVAAVLTGRRFYGIELDRNYFDIMSNRLDKATQKLKSRH